MDNSTQQEIDRLHDKLASIYRRGRLTSGEHLEATSLWARIERLESAQVAVRVKENNARAALVAARELEGIA